MKLHSVIAVNCLKQKLENQYIIWLIARELAGGSGKCKIVDLKKRVIFDLQISNKTFYNYLNKGNNIFWLVQEHSCYLRSLEKVIHYFEPLLKFSFCYEFTYKELFLYGIKPKDICVSLVVAGDPFHKPVSLSYMASLLHCSKSTVKRHLHPHLIHSRANFVVNKIGFQRHWNSYKLIAGRHLSNKYEKPCMKNFISAKTSNVKLKRSNNYYNQWEMSDSQNK